LLDEGFHVFANFFLKITGFGKKLANIFNGKYFETRRLLAAGIRGQWNI